MSHETDYLDNKAEIRYDHIIAVMGIHDDHARSDRRINYWGITAIIILHGAVTLSALSVIDEALSPCTLEHVEEAK